MPSFAQLFVNPSIAKADLGPTPTPDPEVEAEPAVPGLHLGPSAPHSDDHSAEEEAALGQGAPPVIPPSVGTENKKHYTEVLDPLWMAFDDPEERTAARMLALLEEVADEALRLHHLQLSFWDSIEAKKLPQSEFDRFHSEYMAYLIRLKRYKNDLLALEDSSTDTDEIYLGLIKRRQKAGPVPDAIMHLYFANQIGVLSQHAHEMGQGFVGRVMTALDHADVIAEEAGELLEDVAEDAKDAATSARRRTYGLVLGGLALGVGGSVGLALVLTRRPRS